QPLPRASVLAHGGARLDRRDVPARDCLDGAAQDAVRDADRDPGHRAAVHSRNGEGSDRVQGLPLRLRPGRVRGATLDPARQRATIARALVRKPAILLLDDCLSAVDADTEARILRELKDALRGSTAILVSHRVAALDIADRVIVLDDGRITADGSPQELRQR